MIRAPKYDGNGTNGEGRAGTGQAVVDVSRFQVTKKNRRRERNRQSTPAFCCATNSPTLRVVLLADDARKSRCTTDNCSVSFRVVPCDSVDYVATGRTRRRSELHSRRHRHWPEVAWRISCSREAPPNGRMTEQSDTSQSSQPTLARRLGPFDATMIVMGGIIGAGIFVNPSVVARQVHTPLLVLGAWIIGGAIALIGAFVYAELAALRPRVGGQYAYLRDAYRPVVAFLYGWMLLLVTQTGGMAAAAIIFGRYFRELTGLGSAGAGGRRDDARHPHRDQLPRRARRKQRAERADDHEDSRRSRMLIGVGLHRSSTPGAPRCRAAATGRFGRRRVGLATAMVPVLFAYGGWQTASFVSGEMRDPRRDLPRGLLIGVDRRDRAVPRRDDRVPPRARRGRARADLDARVGGHAAGTRRTRGAIDRARHRDLDGRLPEPEHSHRAARLLRDGARRRVLRAVGTLHPRTRVPVVAIVLQGAGRRSSRSPGSTIRSSTTSSRSTSCSSG